MSRKKSEQMLASGAYDILKNEAESRDVRDWICVIISVEVENGALRMRTQMAVACDSAVE